MTTNLNMRSPCSLRIRCFILLISISLVVSLAACMQRTPEVTSEPSPQVVITAWTARIIGELVNVDGCVRVRNQHDDYAVVWTPDVTAEIEGDEVRITTGIVRNRPQEIVIHFGDTVNMSGGETSHPDEELLKNIPDSCEGPYWVVGFTVERIESTDEP